MLRELSFPAGGYRDRLSFHQAAFFIKPFLGSGFAFLVGLSGFSEKIGDS